MCVCVVVVGGGGGGGGGGAPPCYSDVIPGLSLSCEKGHGPKVLLIHAN